MSQTPNPLDSRRLKRASIAGVALAAAGIVLFVLLWIVLGNAGVDQFPRLILSLCVPPGVIALIMGIYFLAIQPGNKNKP